MKKRLSLSLLVLAIFLLLSCTIHASGGDLAYNGNDSTGQDIMLQAFHWDSANQGGTWYNTIYNNAATIRSLFTVVWFPPPSSGTDFAKQGYLPTDWYNLSNYYGSQTALKSAVNVLKTGNACRVLADIVVNHRNGMTTCPHSRWINYSSPTMTPGVNLIDGDYDTIEEGKQHTCRICANNNHSEGTWSYGGRTYYNDDYDSAPDLSHWSTDTRTKISNWLNWLKDPANAGFDGWRFDYIRGFSPTYLGEYNAASTPYLSVGEFWKFEYQGLPASARQALADVINASGNRTMVFDTDLKRSLNNSFQGWIFSGGALSNTGANGANGLIGWWSQAAVTYVDNHDTGWSPASSQSRWPLPCPCNGDLISVKCAYAYILTHPGIPCVYWADWMDRNVDLKNCIEMLIKIRRSNNVKRWSRVWVDRAENGLYAAYIGDENAEQVAIKIGNQGWGNYEGWQPSSSLGLTKTFTRYYPGGHAFTVFYKNTAY